VVGDMQKAGRGILLCAGAGGAVDPLSFDSRKSLQLDGFFVTAPYPNADGRRMVDDSSTPSIRLGRVPGVGIAMRCYAVQCSAVLITRSQGATLLTSQ
jgi:hypothetical protein